MRIVLVVDVSPPTRLLRAVDTSSVEFEELRDSIETHGLCKPILVRPVNGTYEVIDGMYRFTAVKSLGHKNIAAVVKDCSREVAEFLQVQLNATTVPTSPMEYAKRLRRIVRSNPDKPMAWVARQVSKSAAWVRKILNLLHLDDDIAKAVERSEIPLSSAYEIAKLPKDSQLEWIDKAASLPSKRFCAEIGPTVQQYKDATRSGRWSPKTTRDKPKPYLRTINEIVDELKNGNEAAAVLTVEGANNPLECFQAGLKWAIHNDLFTLRKHNHDDSSRQRKN